MSENPTSEQAMRSQEDTVRFTKQGRTLDDIIEYHEAMQRVLRACERSFGAEDTDAIYARHLELLKSPNPKEVDNAWSLAVSEYVLAHDIKHVPAFVECIACGEFCLWAHDIGSWPYCGCEDGDLMLEKQIQFEEQHGGAVTEEEAGWRAMSDEEKAYAMFEEGWTIPSVAKELGIPYASAEQISDRQLHDRAVERHDPANCCWCRERLAG